MNSIPAQEHKLEIDGLPVTVNVGGVSEERLRAAVSYQTRQEAGLTMDVPAVLVWIAIGCIAALSIAAFALGQMLGIAHGVC